MSLSEEALGRHWYAQPNDLIGGWAIMTGPQPPSAVTRENNLIEVGDFLSESLARHIADLHNEWLEKEKTR